MQSAPTLALLLPWIFSACAVVGTREPVSLVELRARGAVLQKHEYSCGAAALATLMSLFGSPMTENEALRLIFGSELPVVAGKDGRPQLRALNLEDLETGARKAGFKVISAQVAEKRDLESSLRALKPAIARLSLYGEYLHFVVLRDISEDWVSVTDPGYGNFKLPKSQFFASWEAGDRVLLTIGRHPFEAWKTSDEKPVSLKRSEKDVILPHEELSPMPLYRSIQQRLAQIGTLSR